MTKIVCVSDLHGMHRRVQIPQADLLIVAGDLTAFGEVDEYEDLNRWLVNLPVKHKVVIAGNHDKALAQLLGDGNLLPNAVYLQDGGVTIEGIRIYGAPWTPIFFDWHFMLTDPEMKGKWDQIPDGIDILVTHGPPAGYLDQVVAGPRRIGCPHLRDAVERVRPAMHVFGHNHGGYGVAQNQHTLFVNCSVCTEGYEPTNEPFVIEWPFTLWE